jgi:hypothetical protein
MTAAAGMVTRTAASIILVESVALGCDVWATGNGKNVGPRGQVTQNPLGLRLVRAENQILQYCGSIRRECLDHVIILSERHLRRVLSSYFQYHHGARTHLSLNKDCPRPRPVQLPCTDNNIIAFPEVGGLHHRYERRAA